MTKITLLALLLSLLTGCTPKTKNVAFHDSMGFATNTETVITNKRMIVGALTKKGAKITANKNDLRTLFMERFKDVESVTDLEIAIFAKNGPQYLIARGKRKGQAIIMAMELVQKGRLLQAAEYNQLYISCIAKYCGECGFVTSEKGEIENCKCEKDENNPTDYSSCEQRTFIKTLEKE